MSISTIITQDDLTSLKKHMHARQWDAIEALIDVLEIEDRSDRNALLALAVCEYELIAKPAAYRNETDIRSSVKELCELFIEIDFDDPDHLDVWVNNAARIIHKSQTFIMSRHGENARMQEFYRGMARDFGSDELGEEARVQIEDVANQSRDFWVVLTKLRARTGMPAAMVDFTGYPIDPPEMNGQG